MKYLVWIVVLLSSAMCAHSQVAQEPVILSNAPPVGACSAAPIIKVSNAGLYQCVGSVWTRVPALGTVNTWTASQAFALLSPTILYAAAGTPLPACAVALKGVRAVVSDATTPTYMAAYASGGLVTAEVICSFNGTTYAWLTH